MLLSALCLAACVAAETPATPSDDCVPLGAWVAPGTGARLDHEELIARLARRPVVLLGETHTRAEHHRWQLSVLAGLRAHAGTMVIGFEAFPRKVQPVLDRWVAGALDEAAFLEEVRWQEIWNTDPALYLPLFHFARIHRIPMVALNVDRALVDRVREADWTSIPEARREGVSEPAPASPLYLESLKQSYDAHVRAGDLKADKHSPPDDDARLRGFVRVQLLWDRAMAEAIRTARGRPARPLVVAVAGGGHLRHGHGIPWQLADLGIADAAVLLPWDDGTDCKQLAAGVADAVFGTADAPAPATPKPRLGVRVAGAEGGVRVVEVMAGSVAARARIQAEDLIVSAAGTDLAAPGDLITIVGRQAPGTWLPLVVRRGHRTVDVVAKFPPRP